MFIKQSSTNSTGVQYSAKYRVPVSAANQSHGLTENRSSGQWKWANTLQNKNSREQKFQGAQVARSESSREWKFQGVNWPGSYWPIRSRELIGPGAIRIGTLELTIHLLPMMSTDVSEPQYFSIPITLVRLVPKTRECTALPLTNNKWNTMHF